MNSEKGLQLAVKQHQDCMESVKSGKAEELTGGVVEGSTNRVTIHNGVQALFIAYQHSVGHSEDEDEKANSIGDYLQSHDWAENEGGKDPSMVRGSSADCAKFEEDKGAGTADCLGTAEKEGPAVWDPQDSIQCFKIEEKAGLPAKYHQDCTEWEKSDTDEKHTATDCGDSMDQVNIEEVEISFSDEEGCIIQVKVEEEEEFLNGDCWGSVERVKVEEGEATSAIGGQYSLDQEAENGSIAATEKLNLIHARCNIQRNKILRSPDGQGQSTERVQRPADSPSDLSTHPSVHMMEKPFKCTECDKSFSHSPSLYRHIRVHAGEKPYSCPECKQRFSHFSHLIVHRRLHTGENPYKCRECMKNFSHSSSLYRHMRVHSGEKPYICTECKKCFSHSTDLIVHQRLHTGDSPYECVQCRKTFIWPSALVVHQRGHSGERPYECTDCKKTFSRSTDLTIHQRIHTGEKPYQCSECKKSFRYSSSLGKHLNIHTGEKPYECSVCMKSFRQSSALIRHQKIHTEEKPFECTE